MKEQDITLVDISTLLPEAVIDMKYATADNLTGHVVYCENRCLLHPDAARALVRCFEVARLAGFTLKIFDAYRPKQAQKVFGRYCLMRTTWRILVSDRTTAVAWRSI